ncbi:MAG: DUF58 domain-containing protein [bacterium]|nr:DUF58 domain-containing protein [bacterium]
MMIEPLPISRALLENYRISSRRQKRPGLIGGHQMRRKGQSLEFYDYRHYTPGDDIRHVDWRASARHGSADDLLVRTYVSEEQLSIIISIDTRDSMQLPEAMPKNLIAAWLAEAISWITLRSDDRVVLHRLFGNAGGSIEQLQGLNGLNAIRSVLNRFYSYQGPADSVNLQVLDRHLKPAVVWLIISDLYFDMEEGPQPEGVKIARRIAEAQDGMRWIMLLDTDSWPYEKHYLGQGSRKIDGPGFVSLEHPLEINSPTLLKVENRMKAHKHNFKEQVSRGANDYIPWTWPQEEKPNPRTFFEDRFGKDRVLQRLFMKENP